MSETKDTDFRKIIFLSILIIIMLSILAQGCDEKCVGPTITVYEPVFATRNEVMSTADFIGPAPIEMPGKIYFKDNYLFLNEYDKGIHVIDNTNPIHPEVIGFIDIPGNKDLAAKGNYLYADNYLDLVVFDITEKKNIFETNRIENVFDQYYWYDESQGGIMIDQIATEVEYQDCEGNYLDIPYGHYGGWGWFAEDALGSPSRLVNTANSSTSGAGIGGSLARFTITDDFLYTVNEWRMKIFNIGIGDSPVEGENVDLGWGIETIFPYDDKLFLGARSGMHIYDNSTPSLPQYVSTYAHINTCDPVVVQGDYAYVTLRSGTECETFTNQLDVIDVSDVSSPSLVSTFEMENPHGLGIDGDCLFISEGAYGLKLFNASDPLTIGNSLIHHHTDVHALDVIPLNNILMMIGEDGLHQYVYDCNDQLQLISSIYFSTTTNHMTSGK
ncbi:MAG: hypothetical protein JXR07_11650 [Reichenbachiella sp.]